MTTELKHKTMIVSLSISRWGNRKKAKGATAAAAKAAHADEKMLNTTKRLISPELLKPIDVAYREAVSYHNAVTLAWQASGARIIPTKKLLEWVRETKSLQAEFDNAVSTFLTTYATKIEEAKQTLGDIFDHSDYPTAEEMKHKFAFRTTISPMPITEDFRIDLPEAILAELKDKMKASEDMAHNNAKADIWNRIYKAVTSLNAILADEDKRVHEATVSTNIDTLMQQISDLNYDNDTALRDIHIVINSNLKGLSKEEIKNSKTYRKDALKKVQLVLSKINMLNPI